MRSFFRSAVVAALAGALSVGLAWAGAVIVPVDPPGGRQSSPARPATHEKTDGERARGVLVPSPQDLTGGQIFAGAAKVSIEPRPQDYGGQWVTEGCATFGDDAGQGTLTHVADYRVRWPENPNCIYMGGYGIGPMNPIKSWSDPYGLWVRAVALSDGTDTVVLTILDGTSYFATYNSMCDGCGAFDLAAELGTELDMDPSSFMFASSHSHTAPDFIGGWGGVPQWYMDQVADSIRTAVRTAVGTMRPATLEIGESLARPYNGERRDFYRSAEEEAVTWFRVLELASQDPAEATPVSPQAAPLQASGDCHGNGKKACPTPTPTPSEPSPTPTPTPTPTPELSAIATVAAYAAHPVTADESLGIADADFPAVFAAEVEQRYGGVGLFFQTGLGNLSPRGGKLEMGRGIASVIPALGSGRIVENPDVRTKTARWDQPVTNSGLTALGLPGFFDRPFASTPAHISAGKHGQRQCRSASPISVRTGVSAAKIGPLWITGAPGEVFSNLTNSLKERNPGGVTMPLAQVNDGLGYIMQSFETDHIGRQAVGFVGAPLAEYEDAYSIDACFGDMVLETTISLLGGL